MKQVEIGKTYKTNKGEEVRVVRELKTGYFLCYGPDRKTLIFDRKGVSVMYVNLFLML